MSKSTAVLLINHIGLYAASISTLIAYLAMSIYRFYDVQKYVKVKIDKKFVFISTIMICVILFIYYLKNLYLFIIGGFISLLFAYICNKNFLISILDIIIKKAAKKTKWKNYLVTKK